MRTTTCTGWDVEPQIQLTHNLHCSFVLFLCTTNAKEKEMKVRSRIDCSRDKK